MAGRVFYCPIEECCLEIGSMKLFLRHIADFHTGQIRCNLGSCQRSYSNFRSYRNHVYDYHKFVDSSRKYIYDTVDLTPGPLYGLIHPACTAALLGVPFELVE